MTYDVTGIAGACADAQAQHYEPLTAGADWGAAISVAAARSRERNWNAVNVTHAATGIICATYVAGRRRGGRGPIKTETRKRPAGANPDPVAPVSPGGGIRCDCGNDTFRLAGIQIEAVCTACGARTPLGVSAFTIRGLS